MSTIRFEHIGNTFRHDLAAGMTMAVMVVPQAMAYSLLAGLPPIYGLYTCLLPMIVYAFFGSSRHVTTGSTALISLLVFNALSNVAEPFSSDYINAAFCLSFMVGVILILGWILRLGVLTKFISRTVIVGFVAAIGVLIFISQLGSLLGISVPGNLTIFERIAYIFNASSSYNTLSLMIGAVSFLFMFFVKRTKRTLPYALVVVVLGILCSYLIGWELDGLRVVGDIPGGLPSFLFPNIDNGVIVTLLPYALVLSLLIYVQDFAIAKTLALDDGTYEIKPNRELLGLGLANLTVSMFQGYPAAASLTRSAVNYEAGAKSGMSSVYAASVIALVLLFLAPLFYHLPITILASIVMISVIRLVDFKQVLRIFHFSKWEFLILMITFLTTLFWKVQYGLLIGIIISLFYRVPQWLKFVGNELPWKRALFIKNNGTYQLTSPLFFLNNETLEKELVALSRQLSTGEEIHISNPKKLPVDYSANCIVEKFVDAGIKIKKN